MAEEPIPRGRAQWLWILIFASMALLIAVWLFETWTVESEVQPGASPEGLTYPAGGGIIIDAPTNTPGAAPDAPAGDAAPDAGEAERQ